LREDLPCQRGSVRADQQELLKKQAKLAESGPLKKGRPSYEDIPFFLPVGLADLLP
jgi:hypothetical protein